MIIIKKEVLAGCPVCGTEFVKHSSPFRDAGRPRTYCSTKCRHAAQSARRRERTRQSRSDQT